LSRLTSGYFLSVQFLPTHETKGNNVSERLAPLYVDRHGTPKNNFHICNIFPLKFFFPSLDEPDPVNQTPAGLLAITV
jgi:hypothetical protein